MADTHASVVIDADDGRARCWWCAGHADYRAYHDDEWGMPVTDDRRLFEKLCLEAFQSGLSWLVILRKRANFRRAFHDFDTKAIAAMTTADVERLLHDAGIVRNRRKIEATLANARACRRLVDEHGSLASFAWRFRDDAPHDPLRATSPGSKALAKALKQAGFAFVGPTTAYAFMQAMGLVNDHLPDCWVYDRVERARRAVR